MSFFFTALRRHDFTTKWIKVNVDAESVNPS